MRLQVDTFVDVRLGRTHIIADPCDERGSTYAFVAWHEDRIGTGSMRGIGAIWMRGEHLPRISLAGPIDGLVPYSALERARR